MVSVNFAFAPPTAILPASQRTGVIMIMFTMMCMRSVFRSTFGVRLGFGSTGNLGASFFCFWLMFVIVPFMLLLSFIV